MKSLKSKVRGKGLKMGKERALAALNQLGQDS